MNQACCPQMPPIFRPFLAPRLQSAICNSGDLDQLFAALEGLSP